MSIALNEIDLDLTIWPNLFQQTEESSEAKMFLLNLSDDAGKQSLLKTYPDGILWEYLSEQGGKNFLSFVPPSVGVVP